MLPEELCHLMTSLYSISRVPIYVLHMRQAQLHVKTHFAYRTRSPAPVPCRVRRLSSRLSTLRGLQQADGAALPTRVGPQPFSSRPGGSFNTSISEQSNFTLWIFRTETSQGQGILVLYCLLMSLQSAMTSACQACVRCQMKQGTYKCMRAHPCAHLEVSGSTAWNDYWGPTQFCSGPGGSCCRIQRSTDSSFLPAGHSVFLGTCHPLLTPGKESPSLAGLRASAAGAEPARRRPPVCEEGTGRGQ